MGQPSLGVVFADISGTTLLYRKIGAGEAQRAVERCMRRVERAVEAHHGDLLMPAADEVIAVFPDADAALAAAVEMQHRIDDLPPTSGIKLSMRIGVHFGIDDLGPDELHGETMDAGRALLNVAGPGQILLCAETAAALSAALRPSLRSLERLAIQVGGEDSQLYAVEWGAPVNNPFTLPGLDPNTVAPFPPFVTSPVAPPPPSPPASPQRPPVERFCLRINGKAYLVDERNPLLTVGRDKGCNIVLTDGKASRQHLRVERRGSDRFFLVDDSTNGTYVTIGKEREIKLHKQEMQIGGRGRIAFGHSITSQDAEAADFESL